MIEAKQDSPKPDSPKPRRPRLRRSRPRRTRLRRSDPSAAGWSRRRRGRGFVYLDSSGRQLSQRRTRRVRDLAIPPAWTDVWICPWPNGHIQAVGRDSADRLQYLYHPAWRRRMDAAKYQHMLAFGAALPDARRRVARDLGLPGMPREKALAVGFRLLDLGAVRVGGEAYARQHGTVGIATIRREHVSTSKGRIVHLSFPAKGGRLHTIELRDAALASSVRELLARRSGGPELLAYREEDGWHDVRSSDVNAYIRDVTGCEATAKDFRTWHANVQFLAFLCGGAAAETARQRACRRKDATRHVADLLGNTPAVARASYLDPRLGRMYQDGRLDLSPGRRSQPTERLLLDALGPPG